MAGEYLLNEIHDFPRLFAIMLHLGYSLDSLKFVEQRKAGEISKSAGKGSGTCFFRSDGLLTFDDQI